jgi:hypothetical protein
MFLPTSKRICYRRFHTPFCHLALAAFLAEADLSSFVILAARAGPPLYLLFDPEQLHVDSFWAFSWPA